MNNFTITAGDLDPGFFVAVEVRGDVDSEPDESFTVRVFGQTNVANSADITALGIIRTDDGPTVVTTDPFDTSDPTSPATHFVIEFSEEMDKASVEGAMSGVPLRQVARTLKLFVQGLCGVDVSIQSLPDASPGAVGVATGPTRATVSLDGRSIAFPGILRHYPLVRYNNHHHQDQ